MTPKTRLMLLYHRKGTS